MFVRRRSDRRAVAMLTLMVIAVAAVAFGGGSPGVTVMAAAMGAAGAILVVRAEATPARAGTVLVVGGGPAASAISTAVEAGVAGSQRIAGRVIRARTMAEAVAKAQELPLDEVILTEGAGPIPADLADARGVRPAIVSGTDRVPLLLGRVPIELAAEDRWFHRLGNIRPHSLAYDACKRAADVMVAIVLGAMVLPLLPLVALAIKLDSRGPVFYSQLRVGLGGQPFRIYKFRTMRQDAEAGGARWAQESDPRITRCGRLMRKTRIDELPQLWNILSGSMTLVGPRPERPEFTEMLAREIPGYDLRHTVKPGLTGWAQVRYRYTSSIKDSRLKAEYDLYYVKYMSLRLDAAILVRTVAVVVGMKGT
jgi:exopolysaccharide biosynthesis polyprenyl glycosylphosphotransferase